MAAFLLLALGGLAAERPATAQTAVSDAWALTPAGLGSGDRFRLIFKTSTERDAASTDIADYNTFVRDHAAAGHSAIRPYAGGFRVVGCTAGVDAVFNTVTFHSNSTAGVPIYWLNGSKVADDYKDFYDGSWDDEANPKDESGNDGDSGINDNSVTGCDHDGTEASLGGSSQALGATGNVRVAGTERQPSQRRTDQQRSRHSQDRHPSALRAVASV